MCPADQIASNMPGYYCEQYQATNPFTHQHVICQPNGWSKTPFPSSCNFYDRYSCWNPSNNCANTLSADCSRWCTCQGNALGSSPESFEATEHGTPPLGQHGGVYCPWWLPQAQNQLSHGQQGYTCWQPHAFCAYPKYGMNFVCTGYGGYWELQGPTPTPKPVPSPPTCPAGWNIWDGKSCYSPNMFCPYPEYNENYVCSSGKWRLQGNPTPKPTPAPVNSVNCPPSNYPPTVGNYCTSPSVICDYGSNGKFECNGTSGKWIRLYL